MANFKSGVYNLNYIDGKTDYDVYSPKATTIDFEVYGNTTSAAFTKYYRWNVKAHLQKKSGSSWGTVTSASGWINQYNNFYHSFYCSLLTAGTYRVKVDFYKVETGASKEVYVNYNATYGFTVQR